MTKIRVALSSPIDDNLYSVLLAHECLKHEEIELVGVITLKVFSYKRFKSEFNRLRSLLFLKIFNKIFNRETSTSSFHEILKKNLFHERKISKLSLRSLCKSNEVSFRKIINPNSQESIDFLRLSQPDLILSVGSIILREEIIDLPNKGLLNVHLGILPKYRGMGVTEWPVIESTSFQSINTGITLHFIHKGVDTGPIISRKFIPFRKGDTFDTLEERYLPEMVKLMIEGVIIVKNGELNYETQESHQGKQYFALHPRMRKFAEKKLMELMRND